MRKQVGLKLDVGLWERVGLAAGEAGLSRTAFVEGALEAGLAGSPGLDGIPVVAGVVRPAQRVPLRAVSSFDAKRGVGPRWRGGVEGSV